MTQNCYLGRRAIGSEAADALDRAHERDDDPANEVRVHEANSILRESGRRSRGLEEGLLRLDSNQ